MRPEVRINAESVGGKVVRTCPHCKSQKAIDEFGLRTLKRAGESGEDVVTNQSWCRSCRRKPRKLS